MRRKSASATPTAQQNQFLSSVGRKAAKETDIGASVFRRYTYRVAISNHHLGSFDGQRVTFRSKDYARKQT